MIGVSGYVHVSQAQSQPQSTQSDARQYPDPIKRNPCGVVMTAVVVAVMVVAVVAVTDVVVAEVVVAVVVVTDVVVAEVVVAVVVVSDVMVVVVVLTVVLVSVVAVVAVVAHVHSPQVPHFWSTP